MKEYHSIGIRPYQMLCLICRQGCRNEAESYYHESRLDDIHAAVEANSIVPLTLRCNTDTVFRCQNPGREHDTPEGEIYNDLRDLTILQLAKIDGAIPVIVSDFDRKRRDLALALGADHAFSPDEENLPEKIRELTYGKGADAIVEVTGAAVALQQALICVARQGRVSLLGCTRISDANIDFYKYVHQPGVSLIGAHTFVRPEVDSYPGYWTRRDDYRTLLALLAAKRLQVRPIISEIVSPEDAPAVFTRLAEDKHPPLGIVFDWRNYR